MTIIQIIDGTLMFVLAFQCFWLGITTSCRHSRALRLVLLCIPLTVMSWLIENPVGGHVTYWSDVVTHVSFIVVVFVVQHLVECHCSNKNEAINTPNTKPKTRKASHAH